MRYRLLGASDLKVSEIALGSWLTYGGGVEKARAIACIRTALDLGINLFDTANVYGRAPRRPCSARRWRTFPVSPMCWRPSSSFP